MTRTNIYQDFGGNIELEYTNGILRQATRIPTGKEEQYAKLVCLLKTKEADIDPVLFCNKKNLELSIALKKELDHEQEALRIGIVLLIGFVVGAFVASAIFLCLTNK